MDQATISLILGILTICMGFIALVMTLIAKSKLSEGIMRHYISYVITTIFLCIVFALIYTMRKVFSMHSLFFDMLEYYILTAAFFSLVLVAYRTLKIGDTFGFK